MEIKSAGFSVRQIIMKLKSITGWFIFFGIIGFQCFGNTASANYPADPTANLEWPFNNDNTVSAIQTRFNSARTNENDLLNISIPMMSLPSQNEWDAMSDAEKALWLINQERIDRDVDPLHGIESNVMTVAQNYAQYLLDNNAFAHDADGNSPWDRLNSNTAIGNCHDFLNVAENLAVLWGGWTLPIERSIYMWMYDDSGSGWGHRHAILWYPYNDNSGPSGMEGFLGIGRASGTHNGWTDSDIIVMNVFDPCPDWQYEVDRIGVFRNGKWLLDENGNGYWDAGADIFWSFGLSSGDQPVVGDWNGDGYDEIGVKRGYKWILDMNGNGYWDLGDVTYSYGKATDVPIIGDWNGDGCDEIGVKRGYKWILDSNGNGYWDTGDITYNYGKDTDVPVAGDWNGDGYDEIGVKRGYKWILDSNGNGYWDANDATSSYGMNSDVPAAGDWNGDGIDEIGVRRNYKWILDSNGNGYWDLSDGINNFGGFSDLPIIGKWKL